MERRMLGRTGLQVTPLGLGGVWLGRQGDVVAEDLGIATVLRALELGINLIDTSGGYGGGQSERIIGAALREWYRRGGRREDLVLSTKVGTRVWPRDDSGDAVRRSVDASMETMGVDALDILLVHDPDTLVPVLAPGGAWDALRRLKAEEVVRAIGLGARSHAFHRALLATGECDICLTYRDYNLLNQSAASGVIEPAITCGAGVLNGMPIIKGLLGGRDPLQVAAELEAAGSRVWEPYHPISDEVQRARCLWEWAGARGVGLLALNLQFCLREPRIASTLVGASTPEEITADVAACVEPIPESVWDELGRSALCCGAAAFEKES